MSEEKKNGLRGMLIHGLIMAKNRYPGRDGRQDRFGIDVACPGCKEMLSVQVPPEKWGAMQEQTEFLGKVSFRTFKGAVYFEALSA